MTQETVTPDARELDAQARGWITLEIAGRYYSHNLAMAQHIGWEWCRMRRQWGAVIEFPGESMLRVDDAANVRAIAAYVGASFVLSQERRLEDDF